jgi:uncharacterized protein DUF1236
LLPGHAPKHIHSFRARWDSRSSNPEQIYPITSALNNIPKGLQGNASKPMQGQETESRQRTSGGIQLSEEQRTRIRNTVIDSRKAPRVGHVDFDVSVGTHVPRHIHFAAVPETLIRIQPKWRGYRYFVYEDEIVIVDPHDLTIVAVVPV